MKINKIVIVGGGSAGWMTAATLISQCPEKEITLIESPTVSTVGVGESTIQGINNWMHLLGINDTDFMEACDATYKLSIKFKDFYKKGAPGFHYPFGSPYLEGSVAGVNDWHIKKALYPETPVNEYAETYYSTMALVNEKKFDKNLNGKLPGYAYGYATAFHFDATKFGAWLRDNYCNNKVKHILSEVKTANTDNTGIRSIVLDNGEIITSDLFIDCTGFTSLLLDKTLHEPFDSYTDMLPNNRAWATKLDYINKEDQIEPYTTCTALGNGWAWNIPLWSRLGAGYVYSDKYVTPEAAKQEFIDYLQALGHSTNNLEFKDITMRVGLHNRIWVKNVCAIGLSAGFIEPLESNGLYTVHKFLLTLVRILNQEQVSRYDRDSFNLTCKVEFRQFAEFVAQHYALSIRDDTQYWKDIQEREFISNLTDLTPSLTFGFKSTVFERLQKFQYDPTQGFHCIAAGMNFNPCDLVSLKTYNYVPGVSLKDMFQPHVLATNTHKETWKDVVKNYPSMYLYLKTHIYKN